MIHPSIRSKKISRTLLKTIFLTSLIATVALTLLLWADPFELFAPRDQQLITIFSKHRAAFEMLQTMASQDSNVTSYISRTSIDNRLAKKRKEAYAQVFSEIPSDVVVVTDYKRSVRFIFAHGGLSAISGGWLKGIEYQANSNFAKNDVIQSLDKTDKLEAGVYVRRLEPNWFIVYQRLDN